MRRTSPSRTPEKRREAYVRQRETVKRWEQERKRTPDYARAILARELGVKAAEVPAELVAARFQQIRLRRAVKEAQSERLYPVIRERYLAGATTYDLAQEFGFDRGRVAAIIRGAGIVPRRRPTCRYGHDMNEANTAYSPDGARRCRKCACERTKKHYLKKKGRA